MIVMKWKQRDLADMELSKAGGAVNCGCEQRDADRHLHDLSQKREKREEFVNFIAHKHAIRYMSIMLHTLNHKSLPYGATESFYHYLLIEH